MDDNENSIVHQNAELEKSRAQLAKRGLDIISRLDERVNLSSAVKITEKNAALVTCLACYGKGTLHDIFWAPDGKYIVAATKRGFFFYEAQSLQEIRFIDAPNLCAAISSDGNLLATGGADGSVRLWKIADGTLIKILEGHTDSVRSVSFSPDNSLLASGSRDKTVRLWQVEDGIFPKSLEGFSVKVLDGELFPGFDDDKNQFTEGWIIAFSPDGKLLACGGYKNTYIWGVADGKLLSTLGEQSDWVRGLAFSPDGLHLASVSFKKICIWRVCDYAQIKTLEATAGQGSLAFSPDSSVLTSTETTNNGINLWNFKDGERLRTLSKHSSWVTSVAFSPDGTLLASASQDGNIMLWNTSDYQRLNAVDGYIGYSVNDCIAFSPDGGLLVCGDWYGNIRILRVLDGALLRTLIGHSKGVNSVCFSPDGNLLASASWDGKFNLWKVQTGELIKTLSLNRGFKDSIMFSPDGSLLAYGSSLPGEVMLWRVPDSELIRKIETQSTAVSDISFSPDGSLLAIATGNSTFYCRVTDGEFIGVLHERAISIGFSPDGSWFASTDDNEFSIHLRKVMELHLSRAELKQSDFHYIEYSIFFPDADEMADSHLDLRKSDRELIGHVANVSTISFSRDSSLLASAGDDRTIRLWRIPEGDCLNILQSHANKVTSISFSPNGNLIASASEDGTIRLWGIKP